MNTLPAELLAEGDDYVYGQVIRVTLDCDHVLIVSVDKWGVHETVFGYGEPVEVYYLIDNL